MHNLFLGANKKMFQYFLGTQITQNIEETSHFFSRRWAHRNLTSSPTKSALPILEGDSCFQTAKSRRENVFCRIDITVMFSSALWTNPFSYSKTCPTFRTAIRYFLTARTRLGGVRFVDNLKNNSRTIAFIMKLFFYHSPACIKNWFGIFGFSKPKRIDVANEHSCAWWNKLACEFVYFIVSSVFYFRTDTSYAAQFSSPLSKT